MHAGFHFALISEKRREGKQPADTFCTEQMRTSKGRRTQANLPQVHANGVGTQKRVIQGPEQLLVVVLVYMG